ncbi:MAG: fibronectin/fibrinogen-binding protein [Ruminococcaceae bacterium]|nr:fibronectin/fibrinogen-binding protein [Oscillospiraceae bacterium]
MALDGVYINALTKEFNEKFTGLRIDKIYQPEHDELLLFLHGKMGSFRLCLSANASLPRAYIEQDEKSSISDPPGFCMLLRKHLMGGKVIRVFQPDFERVIRFEIESINVFGDLTVKTLVIEIMGRHSNIIFLDENEKILDSIKRVDFSVSSIRQILPGLKYENPPSQGKKNPLSCGVGELLKCLEDNDKKADKCILDTFKGISPLIAREIVYRGIGIAEIYASQLSTAQKLDIATQGYKLFQNVLNGEFEPCYLVSQETGKHIDFSAFSITQYENLAEVQGFESAAHLIYEYYKERGKKERKERRNAELMKVVTNNIERCIKKIERQTRELADTEKREQWKIWGELITANIYKINKGDKTVCLENYYEEGMPEVTIPLDTSVTPAQNAQRYFKKYSKAKTAQLELTKQLNIAKEELLYLESVEEEIEKAETTDALSQIAEELYEQGYLRRNTKEKKKKQNKQAMPQETRTTDGFCVFIGKNNKQNDFLTCKMAHNNDLWFHTKDIHGSHVVMRYEQGREFTDNAILEAAAFAAFYSKAKNSENVPVDYTKIKFVKKPSGAKPGFVIYTDNNTVYVTPKKAEDE